jgi:flagellar L-ring protein precursor FlgH
VNVSLKKLASVAGVVVLAGCATTPPAKHDYLQPQPLPVKPKSPPRAANGSAFQPNAHISLFQDHRLWRAGDLVTINIVQNASASTGDNTQLQRQSSTDMGVTAFLGMPLTFGHHAGRQFSPTFKTKDDNSFKGKGQTSASNEVTGQVTAVVTEVEPNGILELQGRTGVNVNGNVRAIDISGYVRPQDIGPDNTVASNDLASMNVQYVGKGPTQSAHHIPWFVNLLNTFWPF